MDVPLQEFAFSDVETQLHHEYTATRSSPGPSHSLMARVKTLQRSLSARLATTTQRFGISMGSSSSSLANTLGEEQQLVTCLLMSQHLQSSTY